MYEEISQFQLHSEHTQTIFVLPKLNIFFLIAAAVCLVLVAINLLLNKMLQHSLAKHLKLIQNFKKINKKMKKNQVQKQLKSKLQNFKQVIANKYEIKNVTNQINDKTTSINGNHLNQIAKQNTFMDNNLNRANQKKNMNSPLPTNRIQNIIIDIIKFKKRISQQSRLTHFVRADQRIKILLKISKFINEKQRLYKQQASLSENGKNNLNIKLNQQLICKQIEIQLDELNDKNLTNTENVLQRIRQLEKQNYCEKIINQAQTLAIIKSEENRSNQDAYLKISNKFSEINQKQMEQIRFDRFKFKRDLDYLINKRWQQIQQIYAQQELQAEKRAQIETKQDNYGLDRSADKIEKLGENEK